MSGCITIKFHDYAETNVEESIELIERLKNDTLVIVVPTNSEKIGLLRSAANSNRSQRARLQEEAHSVEEQAIKNAKSIYRAFKSEYTFSDYVFIPDSLVHQFEEGASGIYFLNDDMELDSSIKMANRSPIKFVSREELKFDVRIGNTILPNPFPNHISYRPGDLRYILGIEDFDKSIMTVARLYNGRLERFYNNPGKQLTY